MISHLCPEWEKYNFGTFKYVLYNNNCATLLGTKIKDCINENSRWRFMYLPTSYEKRRIKTNLNNAVHFVKMNKHLQVIIKTISQTVISAVQRWFSDGVRICCEIMKSVHFSLFLPAAPEMVKGDVVGPPADIWSVGVLTFVMWVMLSQFPLSRSPLNRNVIELFMWNWTYD